MTQSLAISHESNVVRISSEIVSDHRLSWQSVLLPGPDDNCPRDLCQLDPVG